MHRFHFAILICLPILALAGDSMPELDHPWTDGLYSTITTQPIITGGMKPKTLQQIQLTVPGMASAISTQAVIQQTPAPLVVLINGTFGQASDPETLLWMAWLEGRGFHVFSFDSTFRAQMTRASKHGMAGNLKIETDLAARIIQAFLTRSEVAGRVVKLALAGCSYGALLALQLASSDSELVRKLEIANVQAYSPPISLRSALEILDSHYTQNRSVIEHYWDFGNLKRKFPCNDPIDRSVLYEALSSVFRGGRHLGGLAAVVEANDALFVEDLTRFGGKRLLPPEKDLNEDGRWNFAEAVCFKEYLEAAAAYWKGKGLLPGGVDALLSYGELAQLLPRCGQNIEVIIASNDPLNQDGAAQKLVEALPNSHITLLPRGGHLGYLDANWTRAKLTGIFDPVPSEKAPGLSKGPNIGNIAAERSKWISVQTRAKEAFESYLNQHPDGAHFAAARDLVSKFEQSIAEERQKVAAEATKEEELRLARLAADRSDWQALRAQIKESLANYVKQHPGAEKTSVVLERLAEIAQAEAAEKRSTGNIQNEKKPGLSSNVELWDGKSSIADYAIKCGLKETRTVDLGEGLKLELMLIPAGKFQMGSPETEEGRLNDELLHAVTISKPYYIGKHEVTQAQFQRVMETNPSQFRGDQLPVEKVGWGVAKEFCSELSKRAGEIFDLPTAAQWEFACRAGSETRYYSGSLKDELGRAGWYTDNSNGCTRPVGQLSANAFGLFDMHGNVWEWCNDWYGPYPTEPAIDPTGPKSGEDRVIRGGSWWSNSWHCRSARHEKYPIASTDNTVGFRVMGLAKVQR